MKISFLIPVYNAEEYLEDCIKSILSQKLNDYEIILVNDSSTDDSLKVMNKYKKSKNLFVYDLKNTSKGPSEARNYAISKASGDYFIFVDADDYLEENFVNSLLEELEPGLEMLKYDYTILTKNNKKVISNLISSTTKGEEVLPLLIERKVSFDATCMYLFNTKFVKKNKFKFAEGRFYEDFGLIPFIILKCKKFKSVNLNGYVYRMSEDSIVRDSNYQSIKAKAYDVLYHYDFLFTEVSKLNINKKTKRIFFSYIANAVLLKVEVLNASDKKDYLKEVKKRNIINHLLEDSLKRKYKKLILKLKYRL